MRPAIQDVSCEREVLAKMLTDPYFGSMDKAMEILTPDCFHTPAHREVYQAAINVRNSGKDVDIINVSAELQRMGSKVGGAEVAELACSGGAVHDITSYAARLKELRDLRSLQRLVLLIADQASSGALSAAEIAQKLIDTAGDILRGTSGGITDMMEVLDEIVTHVEEVRSGKAAETAGTPTGFREIDRRGGLVPTDLIVIAGGTSQGKTSLATSIAVNAMRAGRKVAFYSMEMDRRQICARILAEKTGASSRAILSGNLSDGQYERFPGAVADFPGAGLLCDDSSTSSLDSILASMRVMKARHGIAGAVEQERGGEPAARPEQAPQLRSDSRGRRRGDAAVAAGGVRRERQVPRAVRPVRHQGHGDGRCRQGQVHGHVQVPLRLRRRDHPVLRRGPERHPRLRRPGRDGGRGGPIHEILTTEKPKDMYKIKDTGNGIIMNIRDTSIPLSYNSARALAAALRKVVERRRLEEAEKGGSL